MKSTVMVHVRPGSRNSALLQLACDLAGKLDAAVIGITGCQPMPIVASEQWDTGDLVEQDRLQMQREIEAAKDEFLSMAGLQRHEPQWRSAVTNESLSHYLATEARCADLIVVGAPELPGHPRPARDIDIGALVLQAGRPVLLAPLKAASLPLAQALIAWKDTREARWAVIDALPLLRCARRVAVVEIASAAHADVARHHVADVSHWLGRHGIKAEASVGISYGEDANELASLAKEHGADLVVAGAYGHGRLREWIMGGVTRDLLLRFGCCTMLSH